VLVEIVFNLTASHNKTDVSLSVGSHQQQYINQKSRFGRKWLLIVYNSGAQTFWLMGHICLSETLPGPQELIISIKIL